MDISSIDATEHIADQAIAQSRLLALTVRRTSKSSRIVGSTTLDVVCASFWSTVGDVR
jgi:hypothetical protein